jgi:hypothetical protein
VLDFAKETGKAMTAHVPVCMIFCAHNFSGVNVNTVFRENFDELCLAGLLILKKSRHSMGELESQFIILLGWLMRFAIRFEFVKYGMKQRDRYCRSGGRRTIAAETLCGSL